MVILGILSLLQCAILVIAIDIISPFPHTVLLPPLLEIYISLALTALVGLMMGLMISSLTANSDQANSLVPLLLILQLLFSGVIFKLTGFARMIGALFTIRWSMIALGSSIGFTWLPLQPPKQNYLGYFPNERDLFPYHPDKVHILGAWGALIVMMVIFGALTIYFLKRKDRLER